MDQSVRLSELNLEYDEALRLSKNHCSNHTTTRLLESGYLGDVQILCQSRTWLAHRAVLSQRCDFFRACFKHPFIVRPRQAAGTA